MTLTQKFNHQLLSSLKESAV